MTNSKVFFADKNNDKMIEASDMARQSFHFFWREMYWEQRRIIPAVDIGMVKAAFQDGNIVEHMWVDQIYFDGYVIVGFLANQPNELQNINQGDSVEINLNETLTDWLMFSCGVVYGGFSIHEMRAQMDDEERASHDNAWGLPFGDPNAPELPEFVGEDHPMALNMIAQLETFLAENPDELTSMDEIGYTMLHNEAVAGNAPIIEALLKAGADKNAKTKRGDTALDIAEKLDWKRAIQLLN